MTKPGCMAAFLSCLLVMCLLSGPAVAAPDGIPFVPPPLRVAAAQPPLFAAEGSSPASRPLGERLNPGLKVLLGFLAPGVPQLLDGKWRAYGFFAVEGGSVAGLTWLDSRGGNFKTRYQQLSAVARDNFAYPGLRGNPTEETDPTLGGFGEYYEDLSKWASSGDFDNDPAQPGVQPETDPRTYNGNQWRIAKINNYSLTNGGLPEPAGEAEVQRAIEAYTRAVYPSQFNWDWTGLETADHEYHRLFDRSENAFRNRTRFATALLANHLLSGLDVLISQKLGRSRALQAVGLEPHLGLRAFEAAGPFEFTPVVGLTRSF